MAAGLQVESLLSVLVQCFSLILAGYVSGRSGLIDDVESRGLATFVSLFSLPALIFRSLATLAFSDICWTFISGILVSKIAVFVVVAGVSLLLSRPSDPTVAGLFAILCTQSNDFAVGYPIVSALYAESKPVFADYLYVLAPVQLLILNPAGIFMMELGQRARQSHGLSSASLLLTVACAVLRNPVILMTLAGLVWNLLGPHQLPLVLAAPLDALAQAFSAAALFLLGLSMVGKMHLLRSSSALLVPVLLAGVKVLLMPLVIWVVLEHVFRDRATLSMANFGFLYGTLPTAPTVFVFALQFGTETHAVASALVLSTIFAAPLLFVVGNMIRLSTLSPSTPCSTASDLMSTAVVVSAVSLPLLLWTLCALLLAKKWRSVTHRITIVILLLQLLVACSAILSRFTPDHASSPADLQPLSLLRIRLVLAVVAVSGVRVWAAVLAVTLALLRLKSLCFVIRFQWIAHFAGVVVLVALAVVSSTLLSPQNSCSYSSCDCTSYQSYVSVALAIVCCLVSFVGVVATQKLLNRRHDDDTVPILAPEPEPLVDVSCDNSAALASDPEVCTDVEDVSTFCTRRKSCASHSEACERAVAAYQRRLSQAATAEEPDQPVPASNSQLHDFLPHVVALIAMLLSMAVQIVVHFGQFAFEASAGAFLNLQYLNAILVHGQGIFLFVIFGLNADSVYRKVSRFFKFVAVKLHIDQATAGSERQGDLFSRPYDHI